MRSNVKGEVVIMVSTPRVMFMMFTFCRATVAPLDCNLPEKLSV